MKTRHISAATTKSYSALRLNAISPGCAAPLNSRSSPSAFSVITPVRVPTANQDGPDSGSWHRCLDTHRLTRDQAFAFLNCDELIGSHVGDSILAAAGPRYFNARDFIGFP